MQFVDRCSLYFVDSDSVTMQTYGIVYVRVFVYENLLDLPVTKEARHRCIPAMIGRTYTAVSIVIKSW